jgi:drug/metabolite transporter (DMT)-like permease
MMESHFGEISALATAFLWTATALAFEAAGKRIGSLSVNIIRLVLAFGFLGIYSYFVRGLFFPVDATTHNWIWLTLSGLVGFVLGDLCLFRSYMLIGARISMLIMALAPPIAALFGWLTMGEMLSAQHWLAMVITLLGIAIVVLTRKSTDDEQVKRGIRFSYPVSGLLLALGGAAGQGIGLVISKYGMQGYNAFASSQIRVLAGIFGFAFIFAVSRRWGKLADAIKNPKALLIVSLGAICGPFLGVSLSLLSVKYTSTGVASTIMAIVPVLIIPPSILIFKEKVTTKEIVGALISVAGVVLFFV